MPGAVLFGVAVGPLPETEPGGGGPDPGRAIEATRRALGEDLGRRVRITVERPSAAGRPATVTVRLDYRVLSALGGFTTPMQFTSTMRVEK